MKKIINKISYLLIILSFIFLLCGAATASNTPLTNNQTLQSPTTTSLAKSTYTTTTIKTTATSKASTTKFTISDIKTGATKVKNFIKTNKRLPNYVTLNGTQVGMASFLHLLTKATIMVQTKRTSSSLLLPNDTLPSKISENFNPGSVSKTSYINFAYLIANYMNKYNRAPAYGSFTLGKANYKSQIYLFSTVMDFYNSYNRLPYRVYMTPFKEESKSTLGWVGVSNLVYYQQPNSYSCGPSSLKMVLSTYGLSISESWLETAAGTTSSSGTSHSGLINAVQKVNNAYGTHFSAWDENLSSRTWTGLYSTFISKNHPVILHVKSWLSSGGHYVVLAGLSLKDQMAKLADPSYGGYRYVSFSDLEYRMGWVTSTGRSDNPIIAITN